MSSVPTSQSLDFCGNACCAHAISPCPIWLQCSCGNSTCTWPETHLSAEIPPEFPQQPPDPDVGKLTPLGATLTSGGLSQWGVPSLQSGGHSTRLLRAPLVRRSPFATAVISSVKVFFNCSSFCLTDLPSYC